MFFSNIFKYFFKYFCSSSRTVGQCRCHETLPTWPQNLIYFQTLPKFPLFPIFLESSSCYYKKRALIPWSLKWNIPAFPGKIRTTMYDFFLLQELAAQQHADNGQYWNRHQRLAQCQRPWFQVGVKRKHFQPASNSSCLCFSVTLNIENWILNIYILSVTLNIEYVILLIFQCHLEY